MKRPGALSNAVFGVFVAISLMLVLVPTLSGLALVAVIGFARVLRLPDIWGRLFILSAPIAAIVISILIARLIVLASVAPRKPADLSVCGNCGYSLQGLPGNQCPECGTTRAVARSTEAGRVNG